MHWHRNSLFTLMAISSVCLFIVGCSGSETSADKTFDEAISAGKQLAPEIINSKPWVFWCRSGWPDGLSQSTHFEEAWKFAKENSLNYLGSNTPDTQTLTWPIVFVFEDGSFEVFEFRKYNFTSDMNGFCSKRNEVIFDIRDKILLVEKLLK